MAARHHLLHWGLPDADEKQMRRDRMDEHKTQRPEPEIVPARRKSGRMRSWKASILACVICILVTALVTSLIFVGKFGGSRNYKLSAQIRSRSSRSS